MGNKTYIGRCDGGTKTKFVYLSCDLCVFGPIIVHEDLDHRII